VLYIAQPALIVYSYLDCTVPFSDIWHNILLVFIFSVVAHFIFFGSSMVFFRKAPDGRRRMLRFSTIFSNAAFMGIPLIESIFGAEATIYASIYNITFNLFLWTLGVHLCTHVRMDRDGDGDVDITDDIIAIKERTSAVSWTQVLTHPITIASAIGVVCLVAGVNYTTVSMPIVERSLFMLKSLVAPLSMVIVGIRLAQMSFKGLFSDYHMYVFLALRHFVLPLLVLGVIALVGIFVEIAELVVVVTIILAATPAATSATMFAEKYDCDAVYTSRLVAISTILSIASMPLVVSIALSLI
jgi:predicted permease